MKSKTVTDVDKVVDIRTDYIDETLKFVESEEMREHLRKWLTDKNNSNRKSYCAAIVRHAPVPIEQKLAALKSFIEQHKFEGIRNYVDEFQNVLNARYEGSADNIEFNVSMHDRLNSRTFGSFDEAAEYIKQVRKSGDVLSSNECFRSRYGQSNVIERHHEPTGDSIYWLLNDDGDILYFDVLPDKFRKIPCSFVFTVPFNPGDIVVADCTPFASPKRVLILENYDTFDSVDRHGVTCLFINDHENLDVGYFKSNEFLRFPTRTHVSAMYRAKTYTGELTKTEEPMGVLSAAIKEKPELGRRIYRFIYRYSSNNLICECPRTQPFGVEWERLKRTFSI